LRASLDKDAAAMPLDELFPVLVPSSFFSLGNWPGPFALLALPGLAVTWAVLQAEQTMRYVDRRMEVYWDSRSIDWRARALENLRRTSVERPWTHEFRRDEGPLFAVAMMHPDGIGPARLLLHEHLEAAFPEGYLVAVPERSCGLALSLQATDAERARLQEIAAHCHRDGTAPVLDGFHPAAGLTASS
jgi:hypothetical protein